MANEWVAGLDFARAAASGDRAIAIANFGLSIRRISSAVRKVESYLRGAVSHRSLTQVDPFTLPIARSWAVPPGGLGAAFL